MCLDFVFRTLAVILVSEFLEECQFVLSFFVQLFVSVTGSAVILRFASSVCSITEIDPPNPPPKKKEEERRHVHLQ